jgi:hypothetical protein
MGAASFAADDAAGTCWMDVGGRRRRVGVETDEAGQPFAVPLDASFLPMGIKFTLYPDRPALAIILGQEVQEFTLPT